MKSSILRAGVALACALGLAACGGGDGDLYLSGSVYNVTKEGLVLQNNGGDDLAIAAGQSVFQFANRVSTDDRFNITVKSIPSNTSECVVTNPTARANYYTIAQISVSCVVKTHELPVTVTGLTTTGLVIVNGSDKREVTPGTEVKLTPVYEDGPYGVTILTQPAGQTCTISGGDTGAGAGVMGDGTDAKDKIAINCA